MFHSITIYTSLVDCCRRVFICAPKSPLSPRIKIRRPCYNDDRRVSGGHTSTLRTRGSHDQSRTAIWGWQQSFKVRKRYCEGDTYQLLRSVVHRVKVGVVVFPISCLFAHHERFVVGNTVIFWWDIVFASYMMWTAVTASRLTERDTQYLSSLTSINVISCRHVHSFVAIRQFCDSRTTFERRTDFELTRRRNTSMNSTTLHLSLLELEL
ncbi:hypothetical protein CPB85DRAFT_692209 [Mucidula mucida]|nr:hypothetical protein CPB85DRAFT_692209 [Mucidula mucida]